MPHVVEVNSPEEFDNHYLLWNALHGETTGGNYFQSFDWLRTYWQHAAGDEQLLMLIVYSGERAIGALPLTIVRESTAAGPIKVLTYPLHDWGNFYGPIGPNPAATLFAGLKHLQNTRSSWNVLDLRWVDRDGADRGRTFRAMQMAGLTGVERSWRKSALIDVEGTFDNYMVTRNGKFRGNVNRAVRRLEKAADFEFHRWRPAGAANGDGDPNWELFDQCVELASRTWQGNVSDGVTLSHPTVEPFLRDVHQKAARTGSVEICQIRHNNQPVAFGYNYVHQGRVFGLRSGFDPEYKKMSPGLVMMHHLIRDSFSRGDKLINLGAGSLECKRHWFTRTAISYSYRHYPWASPVANIHRAKDWLKSWWAAHSS